MREDTPFPDDDDDETESRPTDGNNAGDFDSDTEHSSNGSANDSHFSVTPFGPFELIEIIGGGGMGVVYKARELPLGRIVALKQLRTGVIIQQSERERFMIEARAVAALDHPNIVPIYRFDIERGQPYYTMKYLAKGPLSRQRPRIGLTDDQSGASRSPRARV
jgi:serine/threonine protein kinase